MKVLVTGSLGFLGLHVTRELLRRKHKVIGLDRIRGAVSDKGERHTITKCPTVEVDISNLSEVLRVFKKVRPDAVIHLAGQYSVSYNTENLQRYVSGNLAAFCWILEACKIHKVKRVLYASSIAANPPTGLYGATKAFNEMAAGAYVRRGCFEAVGMRYAAVYGPQQRKDTPLYKATKDLLSGKPIRPSSDYDKKKEWIEVREAARVTADLLDVKLSSPHEIGIVAADDYRADLGDALAAAARAAGVKERYPDNYTLRERKTKADLSMLRKLNLRLPSITLDEGMKDFISWVKGNN